MNRLRLSLFILLFTVPILAADQFASVRDSIRVQLVQRQVPSVAVAVAKGDKIIWEEGFGWANREKRIPASEHITYSLASISKPISATALMTLVKAGKIDLDKPINDYLGSAKLRARVGDVREATVRTVANHSSGLPLHYQFFYEDEPSRPPSPDETILRFGNLLTIPGEHYQYSNLGFGILGYVISRVSGKTYSDFMREEVFLKLGMTRSSVYISPALTEFQAVRYGTDGLPIPPYEFDHAGASAVYASAHDLVRFGMFHLKTHLAEQATILPDSLIDEMQKPTMKTGPEDHYGIGWSISDRSGYHVVSHTGGMPGVATVLRIVPAEKLAVVVLCNASDSLPHRIADEIMADMLPNWKAPPNGPRSPRGELVPPRELVGVWKGKVSTYEAEIPLAVRVQESGDIHVELGDQLKTVLNNAQYEDGFLTGRIAGNIGIKDVSRRPCTLTLNLKLRNGTTLNGAVTAMAEQSTRVGYALTQWVNLAKQ